MHVNKMDGYMQVHVGEGSFFCTQQLTQAPPTNFTHLLLQALLSLHMNVPSVFLSFTLRWIQVAVLMLLREMSRAGQLWVPVLLFFKALGPW